MKKIIFFSSFLDETHFKFESSFIRKFVLQNPSCEYIFIGQNSHIDFLLPVLDGIPIKIIACDSKSRKELILSAFYKIVFLKGSTVIHLTNYFPFCLGSFFFLFKYVDIIVMHAYWRDIKYNFCTKLLYYLLLNSLLSLQKNIKILVLGEWIFYNIQNDKMLPESKKKMFLWVDHPYLELSERYVCKKKLSKILKFGFFSWEGTDYKNINYDSLLNVKNLILSKGGKVLLKPDYFVNEKEFEDLFQKVDYSVFLSSDPAYKYRCSSILLQSIVCGRPILCLRGNMTSYLFNRYGDIGYIYNDIDDMLLGIETIISGGRQIYSNYQKQLSNILLAKNDILNSKVNLDKLK